jgi:putative heme iron utilization protein
MPKIDPIRPTDDEARTLARSLIARASHAALAFSDTAGGRPAISRIAFGTAPDGTPLSLISALAQHTMALKANPACALLLGEPGAKGDPLTHPRLSLNATAVILAPDDPARPAIRAHYLSSHPKAKLYVDFSDFAFVLFPPDSALLNGGFGQAFRLTAADLRPRPA